MLQNPNPRTSLMRGVGPTLTTNWLARGWKYSAAMRKFILNGFGIFLVLIACSLWTKSMGGAWALVPWTIGLSLLIGAIAAGLPFAAVTTPPVWFVGFIRHQAGGTPGPSAEDGFNGGWDYVKGLWKGFRDILFWTPLVFFGIGFFRVEDNLAGVIPFLGVSLALIIHYAGSGGPSFFRGLVVLIYTLIAIWIPVITWFPAAAERQEQFLNWWTLNVSRNGADKASEAQNADRHAKNVLAADSCFAGLKKMAQPTQEDKDRCEALRKSVGSYVYRNAAERARAEANAALRSARVTAAATCWASITPKSTPEEVAQCEALDKEIDPAPVTAVSTTPPPPQGRDGTSRGTAATTAAVTDPSTWTCTPYREFDYSPQQQFRIGFKTEPGKYLLTFEGERQHIFHRKVKENGQETARDEKYAACRIDAAGKKSDCQDMLGKPLPDFTVRHEELARWLNVPLTTPDRSQPYGKIVARVDGKTLMIGSKGWFETKSGDVGIDLNVDSYPLNYMGHGLKGTLHRCEAA